MKTPITGIAFLLVTAGVLAGPVSSGVHRGGNDRAVPVLSESADLATPMEPQATRSALSRMADLKAPNATTACLGPKGSATLGVTISGYLGNSGSCTSFDPTYGTLYADFYVLNATAGQPLHVSETSSSFNGIATIQDYNAGTVLASCSSISPSCGFDYTPPTSGRYMLGVAAYGFGNYSALVSSLSSAGAANLVPYKPAGWSDRIVVTKLNPCISSDCPTPITLVDATGVTSSDALFISYAADNSGIGDISASAMSAEVDSLYLDGVKLIDWQDSWTDSLPGGYWYWSSVTGTVSNPLRLSAGSHTLQIRLDTTNAVAESAEGDNIYTKTFVVSAGTTPPPACGGPGSVCLDGRFKVSVGWVANGTSGMGTPVAITGDSAYFWFFGANAAELMVKVVDGRTLNGKFWFFYGALSDVLYAITVVDTQTGASRTYTNPQGNLASVADTSAF